MKIFPLSDIQLIIEALLISAEEPISINDFLRIFKEVTPELSLSKYDILEAIDSLKRFYQGRSIEISEVASGFRFQVRLQYTSWLQKFLPEKQERYSQATLETLALIAYRQPITRGEIEQIRGVSVSSYIIKTLLEREWIRMVGYKQVPGKPMLYSTTTKFLNDFNLTSLHQLPKLTAIRTADHHLLEQGEFDF